MFKCLAVIPICFPWFIYAEANYLVGVCFSLVSNLIHFIFSDQLCIYEKVYYKQPGPRVRDDHVNNHVFCVFCAMSGGLVF